MVWPFFQPKPNPHIPPGKPTPTRSITRKNEPKMTIVKNKGSK